MCIQEALSIVMKKFDKMNLNIEESPTSMGLKYLFDCYNRIEEEERQYPKVKK